MLLPKFKLLRRSETASRLRFRKGFTLVEIMVSAVILGMLAVGLLATLIQSRKLTEGSIYQSSVNTIMQGYIEQIKNMEFSELPYLSQSGTIVPGTMQGNAAGLLTRSINTVVAGDGTRSNLPDPLTISSSTIIPDKNLILNEALPAGVVDNIKFFDINNTPENPKDDLRLRMWVWINDISDPAMDATEVRGITIIYSWRSNPLPNSKNFVGTIRSIRSAVPTF